MSEGMEMNDRISAPLSCTNCQQVVTVRIARHATGNLTIVCTNCGHEHYRYCKDGVITEDRWQGNVMVPMIYYSTTASSSTDTMTYTSSGTTAGFLRNAWHNTDTASNSW